MGKKKSVARAQSETFMARLAVYAENNNVIFAFNVVLTGIITL